MVFMLMGHEIWAELYKPAGYLLDDLKKNEKNYDQDPSSNENKFELAMSYAYTGRILEGWDTLKKVDKSYAPVVIAKYETLSKKEPGEWRHFFKLGFGYYFQEKKPLAADSFERALSVDPSNIWSMGFLAFVKGDVGQVDEAISLCKKAIQLEPNAIALHVLLGVGYGKKGDYMGVAGEGMIAARLKTEEAFSQSKSSKNVNRHKRP